MVKIVKNDSKGYGYNYASLSDIANQGFEIPKMKTGTDTVSLREYMYYYDTELKEWIRGAEIVVPENIISKDGKPKMNSAQLFASAVTYSRRVTTLMALGLATNDDGAIENLEGTNIFDMPVPDEMPWQFTKLYSTEEQSKILEYYKVKRVEEIPADILEKYVMDRYGKK